MPQPARRLTLVRIYSYKTPTSLLSRPPRVLMSLPVFHFIPSYLVVHFLAWNPQKNSRSSDNLTTIIFFTTRNQYFLLLPSPKHIKKRYFTLFTPATDRDTGPQHTNVMLVADRTYFQRNNNYKRSRRLINAIDQLFGVVRRLFIV